MGNSCLLPCDLFNFNGDPRVLYHTCSIHPSNTSASGFSTANILNCDLADLTATYDLGSELGRGQFGVIRLCTHRLTGQRFACKSIAKSKLTTSGDVGDVQREIQIMRQLAGHPNIVELKDVYEDGDWVHMVMELCEGGELFDRIVEKRVYSEGEAARVCKTIMEVTQFCHANGVMHRDLKPENILLASKSSCFDLKVADFGLAVYFRLGEYHSGMAGSAYYIAPEVLRGEYSQEVDIWSAGVVLYVMLSGVPPFWDETEEGIFDAIRYGHLDLTSDPWPQRSASVKELIRGMLCHDTRRRLTPGQVLNHEWIIRNTTDEETSKPSSLSLPRCNTNIGSWRSWQTAASASSSSSSDSDTGFLDGLMAADKHRESFQDFVFDADESANLPSSVCEPVREEESASSSQPESPRSSHHSFDKWTSFKQVTEPTFHEFLALVISSLDDSGSSSPRVNTKVELGNAGCMCTCTVVAASRSRRTLVVNSPKGRFLVVHDRENMRIGWKQQPDSSGESVARSLPDSTRLLWSSYPPAAQTQR